MNSQSKDTRFRRRRALLPVCLLAASLAAPLAAAPGPPPGPAPPAPEGDEVKETLQVLMIVSMKKALALTREQEMEVVPKIQRMFEERDRFSRERRDALRRLQVRLQEESAPPQDFRGSVAQLDGLERQYREMENRLRGEIDRSLNPRQQAELRLFVPRFRHQMQAWIDEARRLQDQRLLRKAPPGSPPSLEEADYPDDDEF